jgi:cytochrome P450
LSGVEEVLRYDAPLQNLARVSTQSVELHSETIPSGARVVLLWGAAGRDERQFEEPDHFDVTRRPKRHLAFGEGIHFCLGAPLARAETQVMLEVILKEMPEYEIVGPLTRWEKQTEREFKNLPVVL